MSDKRKKYNKIGLSVSLCLLLVWGLLGMGTTLAWFSDSSGQVRNQFYFGTLDLDVYYRDGGKWLPVEPDTKVFNDQALYEPGYVQAVYLKVVNHKEKSMMPFRCRFAVDVESAVIAKSVLGNDIYLPDYLKFGVMYADSEMAIDREVAELAGDRDFAGRTGNYPLNTYTREDDAVIPVGGERYIALVVRMPEEIGNEANYRGSVVPEVQLGLTITASQLQEEVNAG